MQKVSTNKDLRIVLNTRLSAEDNIVSAASKARGLLFHLKRFSAALTPNTFLLLYFFIGPHFEYTIKTSKFHPIPRRGGIGKRVETRSEVNERASTCPF